MKRFKFKTSPLDIIGVVLIVGIIIAAALPSHADYMPRASITAALAYTGNVRRALESACSDGSFGSKQTLKDVGVPDSEPKAFIFRLDYLRVAPNTVRLKAILTDIYGSPFFGLFKWKVIPQGSTLEFEYTCSAENTLSTRFSGSTVEAKYLPAVLRKP